MLFLPVSSYFNHLLINPFLFRGDSGTMIGSNGTDVSVSLSPALTATIWYAKLINLSSEFLMSFEIM
jgi:hypothetical protein